MRRWLACAALGLAGCGRVGFDARADGGGAAIGDGAHGDGADAASVTQLGPIPLPDGGQISQLARTGSGVYYAITAAQAFRSDDGLTWVACGALDGELGVAVDPSGSVYLAAHDDIYRSTDQCATWTAQSCACAPSRVGYANGTLFALVQDGGVNNRFGTGLWEHLMTPLDGDTPIAFAASPDDQTIIIGSARNGTIRSTNGGASFTADTSGQSSFEENQLAIAASDPTRVYAIEGQYDQTAADTLRSDDGGATWVTAFTAGGNTIAVDPGNPDRAVAYIYQDLIGTTDGFTTFHDDLRDDGMMDQGDVYDLLFAPSGQLFAATARGVWEADDETYDWQPRHTGLAAWTINSITVAGSDVYMPTDGGILVSAAGAPYTVSVTGMRFSTESSQVVAIGSTLVAGGIEIRASTDGGATWSALYTNESPDGYFAYSMAVDGTRLIAGTATRVLTSDPPYTTWTPHAVGASQQINALLVTADAVYAGAPAGLFVSTDDGVTFTQDTSVSGQVDSLAQGPGGVVIVGTNTAVWTSSGSTFVEGTLSQGAVYALAANATTIAAATDDGLYISHDAGATWTVQPDFAAFGPSALAFEPSGDLLVGTFGLGATRIAPP